MSFEYGSESEVTLFVLIRKTYLAQHSISRNTLYLYISAFREITFHIANMFDIHFPL